MGKFFKTGGLDAKAIMKDFVVPGVAIGGVMGAGITLATKKKGEKLDGRTLAKGVGAGIAGDVITAAGTGIYNQLKHGKI